jgi:thiol-disulfide isomerase/thioredoxin
MHFNSPNVYYLEDGDFDANYNLNTPVIDPRTKLPFFAGTTIVLVQGNFCGFCTKFKPAFQQVADDLTHAGYPIEFATIQIDSENPSEQSFKNQQVMESILRHPMKGVPTVVKFNEGQLVDVFSGNNTYDDLKHWSIGM